MQACVRGSGGSRCRQPMLPRGCTGRDYTSLCFHSAGFLPFAVLLSVTKPPSLSILLSLLLPGKRVERRVQQQQHSVGQFFATAADRVAPPALDDLRTERPLDVSQGELRVGALARAGQVACYLPSDARCCLPNVRYVWRRVGRSSRGPSLWFVVFHRVRHTQARSYRSKQQKVSCPWMLPLLLSIPQGQNDMPALHDIIGNFCRRSMAKRRPRVLSESPFC